MSDYLDVHAMADGQVSSEEAKALREKMQNDLPMQSEYEAVTLLKTALQTHCKGVHCEETWSTCCERLAAIDKTERVNSFVGKFAWQLCGSFVVLVLLAGAWARMGNSRSIDASQVPTMAGFSAMPASSGDQFGFQKFLRDTWRLESVSGRNYFGRTVMRYDLADGIGRFSVYVVPGVEQVDGASHREVQGHNCYNWIHNGAQFIVVSDRDHSELEAIAAKINQLR